MSYHGFGLDERSGTTPTAPPRSGVDPVDVVISSALTEPIYGQTGSSSRSDSRLPAPPPRPSREYTEYAAPLEQGPIGGPIGRSADGGACSQDGDCQSGACNTIEQKCYTPVPSASDIEDVNLGTGMKYSTDLDKGGMQIGAGGGGGLPSGGDGCPSGSSAVMGPDGKTHCCPGGKCCPGQHLILKVDPTAKEGVGCACAPGYSKFVANTQDPMLSDCVKGPGDPPAGGAGGSTMMIAGAAALALLLFRK